MAELGPLENVHSIIVREDFTELEHAMVELDTTPLTENFGIEVNNVDLSTVSSNHLFADIRHAFDTHSALLFRNQNFTQDNHVNLAKLFGPLEDRSQSDLKVRGKFKVPKVSNVTDDGSVTEENDLHTLNLKANQLWHTDSTFLPIPALVNILVARVVTSTGGETELATTRAAWRDMPEELKSKVRGKSIWHRYGHSRKKVSEELANNQLFTKWEDQCWKSVWTNPANGEEALYVASHAFRIEGMSEEESEPIIDELASFCTQPHYVYSHKWKSGDVLIWDERATLHRGMPWPYDEPRTLSSICCSVTVADGLETVRGERAA
ncbi:MAG: TauD/TfdA dioxygenase family protein [Hyphomicrobiales bacterium]